MSIVPRFKTAKVFAPLWTSDARFLGAHGGRGSGKSQDAANRMIRKMLEEQRIRCACVREVQNSIKDSVHQLLVSAIQRAGVGGAFDILEQEIRCIQTGSTAIFKGMKDQNAESIKSMEGVKYLWFEEAQTASDKAIRLLRPTIRAKGSQIWFTWNPSKRTDPVDILLRGGSLTESEACVVQANYYDNPWFPDELELERQIDKRGDQDNYAHVWLGEYQAASDMQFISDRDVRASMAMEHPYTDLSDVLILGVDVARYGDDKSCIVARRGHDCRSIPPIMFSKVDTMQLAGRIKSESDNLAADAVFIDEGGIGAGVVDRCIQLGMDNVIGVNFGGAADRTIPGLPKCRNKRAQMWATMRAAIQAGLALRDCDSLYSELTAPQYLFDVNNAIQLEKKEDMKKRGFKSPDEADAIALTYAYPVEARRVMQQHERQMKSNYNPWG